MVRTRSKVREFQRKIHFFHYDARTYDARTGQLARIRNLTSVFTYISRLPCNHQVSPNRYIQTDTGDDYAMFVDTIEKDRVEGRMALVRRGVLPDVERNGTITPLTIASEAGLAELSHFVLYLTKPVLGVEFNFYGPRAMRIGWYLQEKLPTAVRLFEIEPYLRGDIEERLNKTTNVTLMTIGVHRDHMEVVKELHEGWYDSFSLLKKSQPSAEKLQIKFSAERKSQGLSLEPLKKVPELKKDEDFLQAFTDITVYGTIDYRREKFDLLEDKLISTVGIMALSDKSRSVEKVSAYRAIRAAHERLQDHFPKSFDDDLQVAAGREE